MSVKPAGKAKLQKVDRAVKVKISWLVDRNDGAPNFEMRKFVIKPGGSIPKHYHPEIEHEQYVLRGNYKVGIGNRVFHVREGDSVFIPSGTLHWYENTGKVSAEFLCVVPRKDKYESLYEDDKGS